MATVTNTIKLPDGTTPSYATVVIELVASTTNRAAGWITASDATILSVARPTVTAGAWTASLTPNADITPSGTVYKVTETADKVRYVHYISVGSSGGTVHDLLVDAPDSLPSAALTDHIADTAGAHAASAISFSPTSSITSTDMQAALAEVASDSVARVRSVSDGIQEWWVSPAACSLTSPDRILSGAVAADGAIVVCEINPATAATRRVEVGSSSPDDHVAPSVWGLAGRRPVVCWTDHGGTDYIHLRVGDREGDIRQWESLVGIDVGGAAAYTELHRIPSLSSATQDTFWVLVRVDLLAWKVQQVSVSQATGAVSVGSLYNLVEDASQCYVASALAADGATLRVAACRHPASGASHPIIAIEVDVATGAVTSPVIGSTFSGNLYSGTNLPVATDGIDPWADDVASGTRWLYAVRPGPADYAVAHADWLTASPDSATYTTTELVRPKDPGLVITSTAAYVSAAYASDYNVSTLSVWVVANEPFGPHVAHGDGYLCHRYTPTGNNRTWHITWKTNDQIQFTWSATGTGSTGSYTFTPPDGMTAFGIEFTPNNGLNRVINFYTSTDEWERGTAPSDMDFTLTDTQTGATTSLYVSTSPFQVGGNSNSFKGTVKAVEMLDSVGGSTVIVSQDFVTGGWAHGDSDGATDADPQGNVWTINGAAAVISTDSVVQTTFGTAGPRFGYNSGSNYLGGMSFPSPCAGSKVLLARNTAGTWTVEEHVKVDGVWESETLASSSTNKLVRPSYPLNRGPFRAVYSDVSSYSASTYTDYESDVAVIE